MKNVSIDVRAARLGLSVCGRVFLQSPRARQARLIVTDILARIMRMIRGSCFRGISARPIPSLVLIAQVAFLL